jgi:hypothetical protein
MSTIINSLAPAAATATATRNQLYAGLSSGASPEQIQILSLKNQEAMANWNAATQSAKQAYTATQSVSRPG